MQIIDKAQSEAFLDEADLGRESWKRKLIINIGASSESRERGLIRQKWALSTV